MLDSIGSRGSKLKICNSVLGARARVFFARSTFCLIFANREIEQIFGFVNSKLRRSSIWAALPGAPAPGKARRPQQCIPHDSQSLPCSKSNTETGEIVPKRGFQAEVIFEDFEVGFLIFSENL